ncbi:hypothetical protein Q31a_58860 [Aureliella helgolandensis]|uniref:Uncharacterized protein n=1 Tax=Aureliella helgolandensis TaxID=2527968 RepID=A0A518GG15_9BACT|nr:hypothetical protein Q31a_58860 [Aureliella helgolandensis]
MLLAKTLLAKTEDTPCVACTARNRTANAIRRVGARRGASGDAGRFMPWLSTELGSSTELERVQGVNGGGRKASKYPRGGVFSAKLIKECGGAQMIWQYSHF